MSLRRVGLSTVCLNIPICLGVDICNESLRTFLSESSVNVRRKLSNANQSEKSLTTAVQEHERNLIHVLP